MVCFLQKDHFSLRHQMKMENENIIIDDMKREDKNAAELLKAAIHYLKM